MNKLKMFKLNQYKVNKILGPMLEVITKFKIIDAYKLKNVQTPCIFVANHLDNLDPPILLRIIGTNTREWNTHLLLKHEFWGNYFNKLLTDLGVVFVDRFDEQSTKHAKEQLIQYVNQNESILIFPEGTRNRSSEKLLPFHYGAVTIAKQTGATIVPFAIKKNCKRKVICVLDCLKVEKEQPLEDANHKLYSMIINELNKT